MQNEKPSDADLKALFNTLSLSDRAKLTVAAVSGAMTGVIRDDTRQHPWKFPFYAFYLFLLVEPVSLGGAGVAFTALSALGASSLDNKWSRWMRGRLMEAFDEAKVAHSLRRFIVADEKKPGAWRVDNGALTKYIVQSGLNDSSEAMKAALESMQNFSAKEVRPRLKAIGDLSGKTAQGLWSRLRNNPLRPF